MHDVPHFIRQIARGRHGAENLSREQARQALLALFDGDDDLQLGAFLIGLRMKGETASELAGFTDAARAQMGGSKGIGLERAVDLPCYAGKRRAASVHLAAALKARDDGIQVVAHGITDIPGRLSAWQFLAGAGVSRATSLADAQVLLDKHGIVYVDLEDACPPLFRLYQLRPRLGLRSFANSIARLLNPLRCAGQLNGIFHTPYAATMARANAMLGQPRSLIFNGAEGEPELYADRQKIVLRQVGEDIQSMDLENLGFEAYPKAIFPDLLDLSRGQRRIMLGECQPREAAVMQRMQGAFAFAAGGASPADWKIGELLNQMQEES